MNGPDTPVADILFWPISLAALLGIVMLWVPYRSGRRPLALFDQFAAYGIAGTMGACGGAAHGPWLWLPGTLGLACGLLAYLFINRVLRHVGPPQRPVSAGAAVALVGVVCGLATGLAFRLGEGWLR